jgi:hypothetical protein
MMITHTARTCGRPRHCPSAGLGVGCGVGVGLGAPLSLAGIPGLGSALAGVSSGLGAVPGLVGLAGAARAAVRGLGVPNLDAGLGCGVGLGYGFGAGLFLEPSAAERLARSAREAAGV